MAYSTYHLFLPQTYCLLILNVKFSVKRHDALNFFTVLESAYFCDAHEAYGEETLTAPHTKE